MNKFYTMLILSAFALTINTADGAWSQSNSRTASTNSKSNAAGQNVLYIQTAREAVIERDLGETQGIYTLTLKGVQPNVAYFGNQPQRTAGKVAVHQFVSDWTRGNANLNTGGQTGALNAALITTSTAPSNMADMSETMFILSQPSYDQKSSSLTFKIRSANGAQIEAGRHANPLLIIENK